LVGLLRSWLRTLHATRLPLSSQVVEVALGANFNGVTKNWIGSTLECEKFGASVWAGAPGGKSRAKDVGHFDEFILITNGAVLFGRATDILGRPQKLGVGVTDVVFLDLTRGEAGEQGTANESKFNDGANRGGGSAFTFHLFEATRLVHMTNLPVFQGCNLCCYRYIELILCFVCSISPFLAC
jgi:hypothetical protein